jgi:sporulation protein YlmC with PRC-barrel domain
MRLSGFDDKLVRTADGQRLGRVHDVLAEGGEVRWLEIGLGGLLVRLKGRGRAHRVAWSDVVDVSDDAIIVNRPNDTRHNFSSE